MDITVGLMRGASATGPTHAIAADALTLVSASIPADRYTNEEPYSGVTSYFFSSSLRTMSTEERQTRSGNILMFFEAGSR